MGKRPKVKYFLCAIDRTTIGIPGERIERIVASERAQTVVYETAEEQAFFSLPALFGQKDRSAPHGLVLRADGRKTTLLTPKIDVDMEIPEENISPLPEIFSGAFPYFRGACFSGRGMILILDTEKLPDLYHD